MVRGMNPYPVSYLTLKNEVYKKDRIRRREQVIEKGEKVKRIVSYALILMMLKIPELRIALNNAIDDPINHHDKKNLQLVSWWSGVYGNF